MGNPVLSGLDTLRKELVTVVETASYGELAAIATFWQEAFGPNEPVSEQRMAHTAPTPLRPTLASAAPDSEPPVSEQHARILTALAKLREPIGVGKLAWQLRTNARTLSSQLSVLRQQGKVRMVGTRRTAMYSLPA